MIVRLSDSNDSATYGGKASHLGEAIRAGLPVPPGYALSVEALADIARGDRALRARVEEICAELGFPLAARSSAIGEDSADASFAGQHATVLNIISTGALIAGLCDVHRSAHSEGAVAYRKRKGIEGPIRIAAVVQKLVEPRCAGVMFTRHPLTGADELVIEAAWGLGEAVVQGMVTPDHYRLSRDGGLLEERPGDKPTAIRCAPGGGTEETELTPDLAERACLEADDLAHLADLAHRCEAVFGRRLDIEWAFADGALYLLQTRPITTR
ncbi:MAG: PEP/pyruvate-binding domain-containing protein [Propylenella sp.]